MKKYRIRKNSFLENAIIFLTCSAVSAIFCWGIYYYYN